MPTVHQPVRQVVVRGNLSRGERPYFAYLRRRFFGECLSQYLGDRVLIRVTKNSLNLVEVLRQDGTVIGKAVTRDRVALNPKHLKEFRINPVSKRLLDVLKLGELKYPLGVMTLGR